jgi:predicted enzyme related to lactoylglutathione lyase
MATRVSLVLDCRDPERLARFWAEALGYRILGSEGGYVVLADPDDRGPGLILQRVPEAKQTKNRMHVDLHPPDIEAEAHRLIGLGAVRLAAEPVEEHGGRWVLLADPESNEFYVCDAGCSC